MVLLSLDLEATLIYYRKHHERKVPLVRSRPAGGPFLFDLLFTVNEGAVVCSLGHTQVIS